MVTTTDDPVVPGDDTFTSVRDPKLRTAQINSAPHPELWPAPLTPEGAESPEDTEPTLTVVPSTPNVNLEYNMQFSGLPVNSGLTLHLTGVEPETWLTPKSDPQGEAHVIWRTQNQGTVKVEMFTREPVSTGKRLLSASFDVIDASNDRRFGEERGAG